MASVDASVVVNYFNPKGDAHLRRTVTYALECLLRTTDRATTELICADGSGVVCGELLRFAHASGITYAPSETRENFADTYNRGARVATGDVLVLCASDIFVTGSWLKTIRATFERTGAAMVCPYLSYSDYIAQCHTAPLRRTTFEPCCMTINVNAIRREAWKRIGELETCYTGNYNDIDYLIRLRRLGLRAVISDCGLISHVGSVTLGTSSQLRKDQDEAVFAQRHPAFATKDFWHRCWDPLLCRSAMMRLLLKGALQSRRRHRRTLLIYALLRFEPLLNRIR